MIFQLIKNFFVWLAIFAVVIIVLAAFGGDPFSIGLVILFVAVFLGGVAIGLLQNKYRDNILLKAKKAWNKLPESEKNDWEKADVYRVYNLGKFNNYRDEYAPESGIRAFMMCYYMKAGILDWFRKDGLKENPRIPEGKKKYIKDSDYRNFGAYIENIGKY